MIFCNIFVCFLKKLKELAIVKNMIVVLVVKVVLVVVVVEVEVRCV